jgi:hypothetical protein
MARPKYQVFVSSTYGDLREERMAVLLEVLAMEHIPVGMEQFPASDDRGWALIQRAIDYSDYDEGQSWTEREYRYARSRGIPVLAFVRTGTPVEHVELDQRNRLLAFKAMLSGAHLHKTWSTKEELRLAVVHALNNEIKVNEEGGVPRPGWSRASAESIDAHASTSTLVKSLQKALVAADEDRTALSAKIGELQLQTSAEHEVQIEKLRERVLSSEWKFKALFPGKWQKSTNNSTVLPPLEDCVFRQWSYLSDWHASGYHWALGDLRELNGLWTFTQSDPTGLYEARFICVRLHPNGSFVGFEQCTPKGERQPRLFKVAYYQIASTSQIQDRPEEVFEPD